MNLQITALEPSSWCPGFGGGGGPDTSPPSCVPVKPWWCLSSSGWGRVTPHSNRSAAVEFAVHCLTAAQYEARSQQYGVCIVKLDDKRSGFVTAQVAVFPRIYSVFFGCKNSIHFEFVCI